MDGFIIFDVLDLIAKSLAFLTQKNLVLFLLQRSFSLNFDLLLSCKTLPDLVNLMDDPTSFANSIHNAFDVFATSVSLQTSFNNSKSTFENCCT